MSTTATASKDFGGDEKFDLRNIEELKASLEGSLKTILGSRGFRENHCNEDLKLLLGYLGCTVAISGSIYGYFVPYPACRSELIVTVTLYVVFSLTWTLYAHFVAKDTIYRGTRQVGKLKETLTISSQSKRYNPEVNFTFEFAKNGKQKSFSKIAALNEYYTETGRLYYKAVEEFVSGVMSDSEKSA